MDILSKGNNSKGRYMPISAKVDILSRNSYLTWKSNVSTIKFRLFSLQMLASALCVGICRVFRTTVSL